MGNFWDREVLDRQHEGRQHNAVGAHHAVYQIADVVVVGGSHRQMQLRGAAALDDLGRALRA